VGKGTTFRIKLPLPHSMDFRAATEVEAEARSFEFVIPPGDQVVVIDDDPSACLQWEMILRPKGFEVIACDS